MSSTRSTRVVERRRRYFVDPEIQGSLLRHAIYCWLWTIATLGVVVFVFRVFPAWLSGKEGAGGIWFHLAPYILASSVLFPIIVFRAVRFSHRFVGPLVRIRRALKELARGGVPAHITVRSNDFWSDVASDINQISARASRSTGDGERDGERSALPQPVPSASSRLPLGVENEYL